MTLTARFQLSVVRQTLVLLTGLLLSVACRAPTTAMSTGVLSDRTALPEVPPEERSRALSQPVAPNPTQLSGDAPRLGSNAHLDPPHKPRPVLAPYPWFAERSGDAIPNLPAPVDSLESRFSPPAGFSRVLLSQRSFGLWLRGLPLAPDGTPVISFNGKLIYAGNHPNLGAVVAIDKGRADLMQCADSVVRLHAEWRWSLGHKDSRYLAAAGLWLPFERYARGDRLIADGKQPQWKSLARPAGTYEAYREYLDSVFAWANTGSLARQGHTVVPGDVMPGDFFVAPGNPGHAVIVLDVAQSAAGSRVALLGQGYMPAQGFYVIRPSGPDCWFDLDPQRPVDTPFWAPFSWGSLRRLEG